MKRVAMWFFLSCKRYMRKWSFLFILLLLPAGVLAAGQAQKKGSQDISIAISVEESGENTLGDALADSLVNRPRGEDAGMFRFYLCRDEEEVKAEVASRRAECGYVIYAGLEEKLDTKSYKRSIGVFRRRPPWLSGFPTRPCLQPYEDIRWEIAGRLCG